MTEQGWIDLGPVEKLRQTPLCEIEVAGVKVALTCAGGEFAAIGGTCAHVGGPLGEGALEGDHVVCPWHQWRFDRRTGSTPAGEAGVPRYRTEVRGGRLWIHPEAQGGEAGAAEAREEHPLAREVNRGPGPIRVAGISTTAMNRESPRHSTSERLLSVALEHARDALNAETRLLRLNDLRFRHCEGYYSQSAAACTWPCTITRSDPADEMEQVYEALVHWADVVLVATPIRWGAASSLYFKMAERMNCIQNQVTTHDQVLIRNKVAAFVITGGQDNIQAVAGQMLTFFGELGFHFPQFPFIAHSRGWTAEDMERNIEEVEHGEALHAGARDLASRAVAMARVLVEEGAGSKSTPRGGRKACPP